STFIAAVLPRLPDRSAAGDAWRLLGLDQHPAVLDNGLVGLDRHHARRRHHLAGLDVELAVVEVALDHVALDEAFPELARPVAAGAARALGPPVRLDTRQRGVARLDPDGGAGRDVGGAAQVDAVRGGHGSPR